jgi:hypothetical protein
MNDQVCCPMDSVETTMFIGDHLRMRILWFPWSFVFTWTMPIILQNQLFFYPSFSPFLEMFSIFGDAQNVDWRFLAIGLVD